MNEQWTFISDGIMAAVDKCVPHKRMSGVCRQNRRPKWMQDRVLSRIKQKKTAFERYKLTRDGKDYLEYTKARNAAKTETRKAVREYEKEIAKQAKKNPKAFYRHVNRKLKSKIGISDLKTDQATVISEDQQKADAFNSFFSSVYTVEDLQNVPKTTLKGTNCLNNVVIRQEEVCKLLSKLQHDKSPGPDNINPRILKECAAELSGPLTCLFRTSLEEGQLPQDWKEALVVPIFKKGSRYSVENYRPISLTSSCCKVLEKIVRTSLLQHMFDNKYMSNKQHGFVHGRSCTTQLLKVMDKLTEYLDVGGTLDLVYLDLAKAFDTVPHRRLLVKLEGYGIGGQLLTWIEQFLVGRNQRVRVAGTLSDRSPVLSGVPQGSVLGPILFICFINDLPEVITSFVYMYADDTKIFNKADLKIDQDTLRQDMIRLAEWTTEWQLRFNINKCKVMYIGKGNVKTRICMPDGSGMTELEETTLEKDLGIWFNSSLKPDEQVAQAARKANQILGLIRRTFTYMDSELMKQLYTSLVRPHLEYGNVVWHPCLRKHIDMLEAVQHRATKMIPGFDKLSYEERLRRMGLPTLEYRRMRGDMIETYKYLHGVYTDDEVSAFLPLHKSTGMTTRGQQLKLQKRECRGKLRANFFSYRVCNIWNSLPEEVVMSNTVNCFKGRFDRCCSELRFCKTNDFEEKLTVFQRC